MRCSPPACVRSGPASVSIALFAGAVPRVQSTYHVACDVQRSIANPELAAFLYADDVIESRSIVVSLQESLHFLADLVQHTDLQPIDLVLRGHAQLLDLHLQL